MLNDTIITVENLGKKYRIRHQQSEGHTALRDVIARRAAAPLLGPASCEWSFRQLDAGSAQLVTH
jgi:hypothetical protein